MNIADFESTLRREGFDEVKTNTLPAGRVTSIHDHPFETRVLVTAGEITLTVAGTAQAYREGDSFTLPLHCRHEEAVGPEGVSYVVGRRFAKVA